MGDRYASFAHSAPGRALVRRFGLPEPPRLHRHRPGDPLVSGPVLVSAAPGGRVGDAVGKLLAEAGVEVVAPPPPPAVGKRWAEPGHGPGEPGLPEGHRPVGRPRLHAVLVFDATGITDSAGLTALFEFFRPYLESLYPNGRVLVCGLPPESAGGASAAAAQQALEGFTRSLAKELRRGSTAQLVQVEPGAEENLEATVRFLVSARSAYVSGQVVRVRPTAASAPVDWQRPLDGAVALVTGAAGLIGAATAAVLARDGAHVVCVDLATTGDELAEVANRAGGTALPLDLTAAEAPQRLADHLAARHSRVDIVVHAAGTVHDGALATLPPESWDRVLALNLGAVGRVTDALLGDGLVPESGRLVMLSSLDGIAGARGRTGTAAAKAGVIGLVRALAEQLAPRGVTVNAVAPGFIESRGSARMSRVPRALGRRMNSLAQAGQPVDVAETVAWLASPGSGGVSGQVVRVCGQSVLGA